MLRMYPTKPPAPSAMKFALTILDHIARQREGHEARLAQYQGIPIPPLGDPSLDRNRTFWRLTLELGMAIERTYLTWLDQCETIVRGMEEGQQPAHRSARAKPRRSASPKTR